MPKWNKVTQILFCCGCLFMVVSCSNKPQSAGESPAATLSLLELAGGSTETTFVGIAPRESPPATMFQQIEQALEAGEIDIMEADRLVMALRFGGRHEMPEEWQESAAESGIPDLALFWVMQRLPSYPAEIQEELISWFPGVRANRVARKAPELNLWPVNVAYASSGEFLAAEFSDGNETDPTADCVPSLPAYLENDAGQLWEGQFQKLEEASISLGGELRSVVVCGRSAADLSVAQAVLSVVTQAIPEMNTFFGSKLSGRFDYSGPTIQFFLEDQGTVDPTGAAAGVMISCNRIAIVKDLESCQLKGTVVHETFHCLEMESQGYSTQQDRSGPYSEGVQQSSNFGRQPSWLSEGVAEWAEHRFAADNNSEWPRYSEMALYPNVALEDREYDAAIFFTFLEQHAGGDAAIRDVLDKMTIPNAEVAPRSESVLKDLFPWPTTWFEFAEALSGFKPLYEQGHPELTDQPIFPYDETSACGLGDGEIAISQESEITGLRTNLEPYKSIVYDLFVPGLSVAYDTVDMPFFADLQYIDVGFAGDVTDKITAGTIKVTAVLRTASDDRIVDWNELWLTEGVSAEPIEVSAGTNFLSQARSVEMPVANTLASTIETDGRFRVCLTDEVEGCFERPDAEIYRDLREINIIIANAGVDPGDDVPSPGLESYLVLLPGAMPGWKAIRVEDQPSFIETFSL